MLQDAATGFLIEILEMDCNITIDAGNGRTLEQLTQAIEKRMKHFSELAKDTLRATAINALRSLRGETKVASLRAPVNPQITERSDLFVSCTKDGGVVHTCLRVGGAHGQRYTGPQAVYWFARGTGKNDWRRAKVFEVISEHETRKPYFVVAYNKSGALEVERRRAHANIKGRGGLAKSLYSVAMAQLSTRSADAISPHLARILNSDLVQVQEIEANGALTLNIHDKLNYAKRALKHGEHSITTALQKAANKNIGMVNHALHQAGDIWHDLPTPFPEVAKRK